jgi:hypothetical protein
MPLREDGDDLAPAGLLLWDPIPPPTEGLLHERVRLDSGARTDGREGDGVNDRFGLGAGLDRTDGADRFGLTEVLGRLGLTDGLDRLMDGLGRLNDAFGRLGLIEGLGAADRDRLDIRLCRLELRLDEGLGLELNDRDPIDPPGFATDGLEGICGEACALGAEFLTLDREPAPLLRPRDWPQACGPAGSSIPSTTATANEPQTRFPAFQGPAARAWFLSLTAYIEILLSPRR